MLGIDEVIDPAATRRVLAEDLDRLAGRRAPPPGAAAAGPTGAPARCASQLNVVGTAGLRQPAAAAGARLRRRRARPGPPRAVPRPRGSVLHGVPRGPLTVEPFGARAGTTSPTAARTRPPSRARSSSSTTPSTPAAQPGASTGPARCGSASPRAARWCWPSRCGLDQGPTGGGRLPVRLPARTRPGCLYDWAAPDLPPDLRAARHPRPDAAGGAGSAGGGTAPGAGPAGDVQRVPDAARDPPRVDHRHPGLAAERPMRSDR